MKIKLLVDKIIIIVAGGSGKRMQNKTPKQFLVLKDKPVIVHTLNCLYNAEPNAIFIIVLPETQISKWQKICKKFNISMNHIITSGGPTRFHSVKNGLKAIPNEKHNSLVAIHDSIRPFVDKNTITQGFRIAELKGNAIPAIDAKESIRINYGISNKSIPREQVKFIQTPQFFKTNALINAYNTHYSEDFTDDASVFEKAGNQIYLFEGYEKNIKITTQTDLMIANAYLNEIELET